MNKRSTLLLFSEINWNSKLGLPAIMDLEGPSKTGSKYQAKRGQNAKDAKTAKKHDFVHFAKIPLWKKGQKRAFKGYPLTPVKKPFSPRIVQGVFGRLIGLEPTTFGTTSRRSNQLSYNRQSWNLLHASEFFPHPERMRLKIELLHVLQVHWCMVRHLLNQTRRDIHTR